MSIARFASPEKLAAMSDAELRETFESLAKQLDVLPQSNTRQDVHDTLAAISAEQSRRHD